MELPAKFADEVDAHGVGCDRSDIDLLAGKPWEGLVREIGPSHLVQNLAAIRAREHQDAPLRRHGVELHASVLGKSLAQIIVVVALESAGGDEVVTAFASLVDRKLRAHPAPRG